jgi:hypothetical protein
MVARIASQQVRRERLAEFITALKFFSTCMDDFFAGRPLASAFAAAPGCVYNSRGPIPIPSRKGAAR